MTQVKPEKMAEPVNGPSARPRQPLGVTWGRWTAGRRLEERALFIRAEGIDPLAITDWEWDGSGSK